MAMEDCSDHGWRIELMAESRTHGCPLLCRLWGKLTPLLKMSSSRARTAEAHDVADVLAEQTPRMQPGGGRPLERSYRSLNENVTRVVLIRSRVENSLCQYSHRQ